MINWDLLKQNYKREKRVSIRKRSLRLIDFFLPYCKNEFDNEQLKLLVDKFIKDAKPKTADEIKVLYRSITTRDKTEKCRNLKFVNSKNKYRDYWGRNRVYINDWSNEKVVEKERAEKRAKKAKKK